MQTLSLVWGILALLGMIIAFFPCLGSLNWLNIPFASLGLIVCLIVLITAGAKPKGPSVAGLVCCLLAMIFGFIRLVLGLGVF